MKNLFALLLAFAVWLKDLLPFDHSFFSQNGGVIFCAAFYLLGRYDLFSMARKEVVKVVARRRVRRRAAKKVLPPQGQDHVHGKAGAGATPTHANPESGPG